MSLPWLQSATRVVSGSVLGAVSKKSVSMETMTRNCLRIASFQSLGKSFSTFNAEKDTVCMKCRYAQIGKSKTYLTRSKLYQVPIDIISRSNATLAKTEKSKLAKSGPLKRTGRKKSVQEEQEDTGDYKNVAAYAVGEDLDISKLRPAIIEGKVYDIVKLPIDLTDALMVTAKFKVGWKSRDAFFFRDGGLTCWNMSESERRELVKFACQYAINPYDVESIWEESEVLPLGYDKSTRISKGTIYLKTVEETAEHEEDLNLEKYAFSNALAQSVNMSVSESNLEKFVEQLEPETQRLRFGLKSKLMKRDIDMKLGEVFLLRHEINLESGLLDTPDIYWDREELETLYRDMVVYLNIPKRIRVINERLNYCSEILQLFKDQMNDQHHVRLEWIIIILILIEVMFEFVHYASRPTTTVTETDDQA